MKDSSAAGDKYLLWTCGLMAIIIVALAVLWIQQRRRTERSELQLTKLSADYNRLKQTFALSQMIGVGAAPDRPSGAQIPVTLDGREVAALLISAETGRGMGLNPREVIIVADELPEESAEPAPDDPLQLPDMPLPDVPPEARIPTEPLRP